MTMKSRACLFGLLLICAVSACANNINVANIALKNQNKGEKSVVVQLDISWENSWRDAVNHDAAWVFVKFRPDGSNEWEHAYLSTNSGSHKATAESEIVAVPDGTGVFVRRSSSYTGAVSYAGLEFLWEYGTNGYDFEEGAKIEVMAHAIEMVYVAEGSFYVGSGGSETACFTDGEWVSGSTIPFAITSELAITIAQTPGCLWGGVGSYGTIGPAGELPAAFPKGYAAFYCMKYEITQRQYTEFLNSLTYAQQANRSAISPNSAADTYLHNKNRHTIKISTPGVNPEIPAVFSTDSPYLACNFIAWMDDAAYAQWSGLRPMTELEFEKACRGPASPVPNEYVWGTASIKPSPKYTLANAALADESIATGYDTSSTAGNCNYNNVVPTDHSGPMRVGIFATATSDRVQAGASYWGIMELGGNLIERCVSVGVVRGREYEGTHGDGKLSATGFATQPDWPGWGNGQVTGANGACHRGGAFYYVASDTRTSDRTYASFNSSTRTFEIGWRCVRTAPQQ